MIAFIRNESGRPDDEVRDIVEFAHEHVGIERLKVAVRVRRGAGGGHASRSNHGPKLKWARGYKTTISITVPDAEDEAAFLYGTARVCWHSSGLGRFYHARVKHHAEAGKDASSARAAGLLDVWEDLAERYARGERRYGRWPIYLTADWQEHLVHLAAHEFAHVLAWERDRKRNRGSEVWIEEVADRALTAWRTR